MPPSKEFLEIVEKMKEIHVKKNQDYSGDRDSFSNFDFAADLVKHFNHPIDQVFVALIGIKLARLAILLNSGAAPLNESIQDTFIDGPNYFALWGARRSRDFTPIVLESEPKTYSCVFCNKIIAGQPHTTEAYAALRHFNFCSDSCIEHMARKLSAIKEVQPDPRTKKLLQKGWTYRESIDYWYTPIGKACMSRTRMMEITDIEFEQLIAKY
jgi:hypothetical protein